MAQRLRYLADSAESAGASDVPYLLSREKAEILRRDMTEARSVGWQRRLQLAYAAELLNAGQTEGALTELDSLERDVRTMSPDLWPSLRSEVRMQQALANMRIGEEQNCCAINTPDSCLLPIQGRGIHTRTAGSTRAIELLEEILEHNGANLKARWLLNVAYMTLGKYPDSVPLPWRIPPAAFRSESPLPRFVNVAAEAGVSPLSHAGGVVVDDLDGDGNLDVMISSYGLYDQLRFYHNNGDGTFADRTAEAGLTGITGGIGLVQADFDNDGRTDVLVLRGGWLGNGARFPCSLLRNMGHGVFADVTIPASLSRIGQAQCAAWLDYDNDGKLDLFVGYEGGGWPGAACSLYHNNGNGTFTDIAGSAGVDHIGSITGVASGDYDGDGRPDLLLTMAGSEGGSCALLHNNGDGTFTDRAAEAGLLNQRASSGAIFLDYDNDGRPDIFMLSGNEIGVEQVAAGYLREPAATERAHLYHNRGNGTFEDVSRIAHLDRLLPGLSVAFGDLDNDGWPDIYVGTGSPALDMLVPNRMFRNAGSRRFEDVTTDGDFGHLQKTHAIAFGDINNDGCQDVFAQTGGAYDSDVAFSALFANPGSRNHWLTLNLEGVRTNRSAIGARVRVTIASPDGTRDIYRAIGAGTGPLRAEIGLGNATSIDRVEILWPGEGGTQTLRGLAMDRFYRVTEGRNMAETLPRRAFRWPGMQEFTPVRAVRSKHLNSKRGRIARA